MRKNARSWLIKILLGIIVIVFVFFYGYSYTSQESAIMAKVNGEVISKQEYQEAYSEILKTLQTQYKDSWNENLIKAFDLENSTLESLIQQAIITQEAKRVGLDVTDKEVQDTISQYSAFQTNGKFDNNLYTSLLSQNNTTAEKFEASVSQGLLKQKMVQYLSTFLVLSDQEIKDQYTYINEKIKIGFTRFSPDEFISGVSIDKTGMNKYFEEHKENYRIAPKIKITSLIVSPDEFKTKVNVTEADIKSYYEEFPDMFKVENEVKARHILFSLASDSTEEQKTEVKQKAASVLAKIRGGEDFEKLAKEYSEDPGTKDNGGDLGYFKSGQMVKAFETAAFKLKKGEVSDLVQTSYGYHIIKVDDIQEARQLDFQEAHDQIAALLINNESKDLADEKILSVIDQMPSDADLAQYAGQKGLTTTTTEYFSEDNPITFLAGQSSILNTLFSMQTKEISDVIELNNNFYVIQVTDKRDAYLPNISEVSTDVEDDYRIYLAQQKAKTTAEEYLSRLKSGSDWNTLSTEKGRTVQTTDYFTRTDFPKEIDYIEGLQNAAFKLNQSNRFPDKVFENETGAFIIRWEEKKGINEEDYKKEKDTYASSMLSTKKQYIFSSWIQRLMKSAEIDRSYFNKNK
jgi:peptidyl-prolyl cis-trans isomerase D